MLRIGCAVIKESDTRSGDYRKTLTIAKRKQGQVGYRRRNRSANGCPPIFADCESS
jgi:hypothetical protein